MPEPLDPQEIPDSAHWLAQAHDAESGQLRFVAMDRQDYREAAFLDDRIFQQWRDVRLLTWAEVASAMARRPGEPAGWIFHIGHVGSTLLARMLGELPGVLCLREPRLLRDLALLPGEQQAAMAPVLRSLCGRRFEPGEQVIVKATSFVSEIAPLLAGADSRLLFMHVDARSYVETILAGENSVKELEVLADYRAERMAGRAPQLAGTSLAHMAAAAWACEMTALEAAAEAMPGRDIQWLDFDRFLADPAQGLRAAATHLGMAAPSEEIERIAGGPLMRRYSKALEYDYSPGLRQELQLQSRRLHGADIESALAGLEEAGRGSTLLRRALGRAAGKE